ncbi:hypothetical protein [Lentzea aerocolonigenes]|uniref:hypothetical protein n=1 Tax=Lentzea aerocolonigenes TaxID=68170 RepID=UPI000A9F24C3|nr:hypothetical protein [Lentzea aerocolonigenes]
MRIISGSRRALVSLVAATVVTTLLAPASSAAVGCTVEDLPVQDGMSWSNLRITGVDGQGGVTGFYLPSGNDNTLVRWTSTSAEVVPRPDGVTKFVTAAGNALGAVVARADRADGSSAVMTYTPGAGYRELPLPSGYEVWIVDDINDRGDVVARAKRIGSIGWVTVLWRADGSAPQVIDPAEVPWPVPIAAGEDGTVLLRSYTGTWLWRDGVLTRVPDVGSSAYPRGLTSDGVVFRSAQGSWKWTEATGVVEEFAGPGVVTSVNQNGFATGYLLDEKKTSVAWQGTTVVATLPLPEGASSAAQTLVGEGGAIAGFAGTKPVRWTCR